MTKTRLLYTVGAIVVLVAISIAAIAELGPMNSAASASSTTTSAADLRTYVAQIEKVRLPVNQLLAGADPILDGYNDHRMTPATAFAEMNQLEERFAAYMLEVDSIDPPTPALRQLNTPYAATYSYEDSYLSALASGLNDSDTDDLPDTQNAQRLAIIEWRTQLEILANEDGVKLPADIQAAGRGEIAPSVTGS